MSSTSILPAVVTAETVGYDGGPWRPSIIDLVMIFAVNCYDGDAMSKTLFSLWSYNSELAIVSTIHTSLGLSTRLIEILRRHYVR